MKCSGSGYMAEVQRSAWKMLEDQVIGGSKEHMEVIKFRLYE